jgi:Protein of unknown function (DUF3037)
MSDPERKTFQYRILRYAPNLLRDEWVNIGVLLEGVDGPERAIRILDDEHLPRVRRHYPDADLDLLRGLQEEFGSRLSGPSEKVTAELTKWNDTYSNAIQFGPKKSLLAEGFDTAFARLYDEQVGPPARARGGFAESARSWLRSKLRDVFRRHRILDKLKANVRVEEFTHPGDTFKFDYAYRNGVQGYLQSVLLGRDLLQCKALTYTAEHIRRRNPTAEFTALTDTEPSREDRRQHFILQLFEEQKIHIIPMNRVEKFAEGLRRQLQ